MEEKTLARIGAVVFVALAMTAAAIEMTRRTPSSVETGPVVTPPNVDPLQV